MTRRYLTQKERFISLMKEFNVFTTAENFTGHDHVCSTISLRCSKTDQNIWTDFNFNSDGTFHSIEKG